MALGAAVAAFAIYWYVVHIPYKLNATQDELRVALEEVERGKKALVLLDDIQKGKVKIDAAVQRQISSLRVPHNGKLISGGVLPPLR